MKFAILMGSPRKNGNTAPMKAALDRMVYALNKYYGDEKGPSIWAGKKLSVITTCGYRPDPAENKAAAADKV